MRWVTEDATLACDHGGTVKVDTTQDFVRIEKKIVLVEPNPEGRSIRGCPNSNPLAGIRSCLTTLKVRQGYSTLVRIAGKPICLDSLKGMTDGTPPGVVSYQVRSPAQDFVRASA